MKSVNLLWRVARWTSKIVALALAASPMAFAVDGIFEINQAKLIANGSAPFLIDKPGSYRLTSNLDVTPFFGLTAISIQASNVTVDLNGFTINGPNTCTTPSGFGTSIQCTQNGTGYGIFAQGYSNIVVKNGIIRGTHATGIVLDQGYNHVVENVTVAESGNGVRIANGRINHVVAVQNGNFGVEVVGGGVVSDVYSALNGGYGIGIADGTVVASNASANGSYGLQLGATVGYSNVTATYNKGGSGNLQILGGVNGTGNVCNHTAGSSVCP